MKGYFFEGDMELTKEWVCKKRLWFNHQERTNTLLLIKKYGELRRQNSKYRCIRNFKKSLKLNLFTSKDPTADCICTAQSILLVIF